MAQGFVVSARSTADIRRSAHTLLDAMEMQGDHVPILNVLETILPQVDDDYIFLILGREELESRYGANAEGITDHRRNLIALRSDVYAGAHDGIGRDRFTAAHELGHYFLHQTEGLAFLRATSPSTESFRDSEWQANTFAREFLADIRVISPHDAPDKVAKKFGISRVVADIQIKQAKKMALAKGPF